MKYKRPTILTQKMIVTQLFTPESFGIDDLLAGRSCCCGLSCQGCPPDSSCSCSGGWANCS